MARFKNSKERRDYLAGLTRKCRAKDRAEKQSLKLENEKLKAENARLKTLLEEGMQQRDHQGLEIRVLKQRLADALEEIKSLISQAVSPSLFN